MGKHSKKRRSAAPANGVREKVTVALQVLSILAAGWWIYASALHAPWYSDDNLYFTSNPLLREPMRLWKAWFEPGSFIEYYPITQSVQWMQWELWGNDPFGYHVINVVLHLVNALLVWRLFARFGLKLAWLGGAIFAVHPLQVESVVWISELKNTLSLTPALLAMCAWLDYETHRRRSDYLWAAGLFFLSMLCKIAMAPFPIILLLYAWWKRGRIGWCDLRAATPFFLIALVLGLVSILSGQHYVIVHDIPPDNIPLTGILPHLALAGLSVAFYLAHAIFPLTPLPYYPLWSLELRPVLLLPWLSLGVVGFVLWRKRQSWGRHAILGLGFFFITLAPFLGFTAASYMNFTWVMDHFLYLPLIGLIGLAIAGAQDLGTKVPLFLRHMGAGFLALGVALLMFASHAYAGVFADQLKLWPYALKCDPQSWPAHYNYAVTLLDTPGRQSEALPEDQETVRINPGFWAAYNDWGSILLEEDQPLEAKEKFEQALKIRPQYDLAHFNLGLTWYRLNEVPQAMTEYREAIKFNPGYAEAHYNLAHLLFVGGQIPEALAQFELAAKLKPGDGGYHRSLADVLLGAHRTREAIDEYGQVLALQPNDADAYDGLGKAWAEAGDAPEARNDFERALRLNPNLGDAHLYLGNLLLAGKDVTGAIEQYRAALRCDPDLAEAHLKLGAALYQNGQTVESAEQMKEALQVGSSHAAGQDFVLKLDALLGR